MKLQNNFADYILPHINCIMTPNDIFREYALNLSAKAKRSFYATSFNSSNIMYLPHFMYRGGTTVVFDHDAKILKSTERKVLTANNSEVVILNVPSRESVGYNPLHDFDCYEADTEDAKILSKNLVLYFKEAYPANRVSDQVIEEIEMNWINAAVVHMIYESVPGGLPGLYEIFKIFRDHEGCFEGYYRSLCEEDDYLNGREAWEAYKDGIELYKEKESRIMTSIEEDLKMFEIPFIHDLFKEDGFTVTEINDTGKDKLIFIVDEDGDPFSQAVFNLLERQVMHWLDHHKQEKEDGKPEAHVVLSRKDTEKDWRLFEQILPECKNSDHSIIITDF